MKKAPVVFPGLRKKSARLNKKSKKVLISFYQAVMWQRNSTWTLPDLS